MRLMTCKELSTAACLRRRMGGEWNLATREEGELVEGLRSWEVRWLERGASMPVPAAPVDVVEVPVPQISDGLLRIDAAFRVQVNRRSTDSLAEAHA